MAKAKDFLKKLFFTDNSEMYYVNTRKSTSFTLEEWEKLEKGLFHSLGVLLFHPLGHPTDERLITFLVKINTKKTSIDKVIDVLKRKNPEFKIENVVNRRDLEKYNFFVKGENQEEIDINNIELLLHKIEGIIYDFVHPDGKVEIYFLPQKSSIEKIIDFLQKNGYNII